MSQITNSYSENWFRFFHAGIPESRTRQEVDFICACAPLPRFRDVLDVCCGMGRHVRALAQRGYAVTGVERDAAAIAAAREREGGVTYVEADIRDYAPRLDAYDLTILMSQSFGYFDPPANRDLLKRLANGLREGGRMILDLWNPEFFARHQGTRDFELPSGIVREQKEVRDGRLYVHLDYPGGGADAFEWQLFTAEEMQSLAESVELSLAIACTDFDAATKPDSSNPRLQFVLERQPES
ncbi:MAG TPA: class I SAM-dependent methyltransferase [Chthoniobacterales bacterium]|nr:class I SAM-dependent methyltransferase [Chthoniobacterales bacterium]